jgi:hypothetical protein
MNLKLRKSRATDHDSQANDWDTSIELLAMQLCPVEEWQHYEQHMQTLAREARALPARLKPQAKVRVFPVWRKYRQQAKRVATLYQAAPVFKRLPLPVAGFVGDLLFK